MDPWEPSPSKGKEPADDDKDDKTEVEDKNTISQGSPDHGSSFVVFEEREDIYPKERKMYTIPSEVGFIYGQVGQNG
jgi:hypothetical protein